MRLLAVDSSTATCSVALMVRGELALECTGNLEQTHARHLLGLVDGVLARTGIAPADIDAYAVTTGPGSFTGLRIGIAAVKGFALAFDRPVVGISTLSALAWPWLGTRRLFCSMIDARKKEVYAQVYRLADGRLDPVMPARVTPPGPLVEQIRKTGEACRFAGSGAVCYRGVVEERMGGRAVFVPVIQNSVRAAAVAAMAHGILKNGGGQSVHELLPCYIRKSDAEKKRGVLSGPGRC